MEDWKRGTVKRRERNWNGRKRRREGGRQERRGEGAFPLAKVIE